MSDKFTIERRNFLRAVALGGVGATLVGIMPAWAQPVSTGLAPSLPTLSGPDIALTFGQVAVRVDGVRGAIPFVVRGHAESGAGRRQPVPAFDDTSPFRRDPDVREIGHP